MFQRISKALFDELWWMGWMVVLLLGWTGFSFGFLGWKTATLCFGVTGWRATVHKYNHTKIMKREVGWKEFVGYQHQLFMWRSFDVNKYHLERNMVTIKQHCVTMEQGVEYMRNQVVHFPLVLYSL